MALVDSGADVNVFDVEIAIVLGLNLKAGEAVDIVTVMGGVEPSTSTPSQWAAPALRPGRRSGSFSDYGVVGQNGFFDHFVISFDRQAEELEIKRLLGSGAGEP